MFKMDYLNSEVIIVEVEKHPCLYDIRRADFKVRELKSEAWEAVAKNVAGEEWNRMDEKTRSLVRKEINKRWKNMKDSYMKTLKFEAGKIVEPKRPKKPKRPYIYQKHMAFLQEIYGQRISESVFIEEERKKRKKRIPIESTSEIKEEPTDYHPIPSTSTDNTVEEVLLPEEDSWTSPDPVVEPQFTLSLASLASPDAPETSNDGLLKKILKTPQSNHRPTITTYVTPTAAIEVSPQSPACSFGEPSIPGSSKEPRKDQFDAFGEYIAARLRSLDRISSAYAQKAIADVIFDAEMGKFLRGRPGT